MVLGIKRVTVCAYNWLLFVLFSLYKLYAMIFVFNLRISCDEYGGIFWRRGMVFIHLITAENLRQQCWFLSSCTKRTTWYTLQGTEEWYMPLPKSTYQPVCYWQPKEHRDPEIKRRRSKIHNYVCLGNIKRCWRSEQIEGLKYDKKLHQNQTTSVSVIVWEFVGELKCFTVCL